MSKNCERRRIGFVSTRLSMMYFSHRHINAIAIKIKNNTTAIIIHLVHIFSWNPRVFAENSTRVLHRELEVGLGEIKG